MNAVRPRCAIGLREGAAKACIEIVAAEESERTDRGRQGVVGCAAGGSSSPLPPHAAGAGSGSRPLARAELSQMMPPAAMATGTTSTARPSELRSDR